MNSHLDTVKPRHYETLGEVFDYCIHVNKETGKKIAAFLIEEGASFAVTQDKPFRMWISQHSADLLVKKEWRTL